MSRPLRQPRQPLSLADLRAVRTMLEEQRLREQAAQAARRAEEARRVRAADEFRAAMTGVRPLRGNDRVVHERPPTDARPLQRERDEQAALADSLSDHFDVSVLLDSNEQLAYRRPGIGPDVLVRLRRNHWSIQAEFDLHGMRSDEARPALGEFLDAARRRERRCVRIIHGKGLGSFNREPVLKGKVARWLVQRDDVIAFCEAPPADGGAGAVLVLLRGR